MQSHWMATQSRKNPVTGIFLQNPENTVSSSVGLSMYVRIHQVGTCLLLSLNIADFLTLLLLLEDQPTVAYSAGIKGNDHLDIAVAILHWARTLPVEIAVSK